MQRSLHMKFEAKFTVNSHLCDAHEIARPTALMTFMQEAANLQVREYGPQSQELREAGQAFVLSRFGASFYEPLYAYNSYTMQSWACESRGFSFLRCHRLLDGERVLAEAVSVWALLDIENKKPLRTSEYHPNFDTDEMLPYDLPARIRILPEQLKLAGEHTVKMSETDINRHMNNTVYADMLSNFLDMSSQRVARLNINYFNEAPLGECLKVYLEKVSSDLYHFRTLREDGKINVEAEFLLEKI